MRLADACGCDVVAEGVEEAEHAEFLSENGCRIAQGFHFGRPVPAPDGVDRARASALTNVNCPVLRRSRFRP